MKKITTIGFLLILTIILAACHAVTPPPRVEDISPENTPTPHREEETKSPEKSPTAFDEIKPESLQSGTSGFSSEEEKYLENLDVSILAMIATDFQSLVAEIQEKERDNPDYVLQGKWNQDFRESEQYRKVLELGLKAVKPAYFIIYKSEQSGLYEYMIASALDEITGYDYSVTEEYGWSDSKQLLAIYNERVTTTLTTFSEIFENHSLNDEEKAEQIRALGIFAVAPLLDEMDTPSSEISPESLETCLWNIIEDHTGKDVDHNLENWREQNERTYRDIIEILE
jgi:hypothetical protein